MARRPLVALLALLVAVAPARAQTGTVLRYMTVQALPGIPSGHCLYVGAGRFLVDGHLLGSDRWSVRFFLAPALNVPASLDLQIGTAGPSSGQASVEGGVYCYALINEAVVPDDRFGPDRAAEWEQPVALRLIWLPSPHP